MPGAEHSLEDRQQDRELVTGRRGIPRNPRPAGQVVPDTESVQVLGAEEQAGGVGDVAGLGLGRGVEAGGGQVSGGCGGCTDGLLDNNLGGWVGGSSGGSDGVEQCGWVGSDGLPGGPAGGVVGAFGARLLGGLVQQPRGQPQVGRGLAGAERVR